MKQNSPHQVPLIIAGPMLRHVDVDVVTFWMVTSQKCSIEANIISQNGASIALNSEKTEHEQISLGNHCFIQLLRVVPNEPLESACCYGYDLTFGATDEPALSSTEKPYTEKSSAQKPSTEQASTKQDRLEANQAESSPAFQSLLPGESASLQELVPNLFNNDERYIPFYFCTKLSKVAHGSCRKAHFNGIDALPKLDDVVIQSVDKCTESDKENCPDILLLTGDQVYIDDVAGPMLHAIHQVVCLLGIYHESFEDSTISNSAELFTHEHSFYERDLLFPQVDANKDLAKAFIGGKRKPVFTSVNAQNHLIALNEMIALYLLSWSGRLWPFVSLKKPDLDEQFTEQYRQQTIYTERFASHLDKVERVFSRIPTYMIFDDHDVTDDWNLTRSWEEQVYGNALSKRIVGNALSAYFLCQGIGNPIEHIRPLIAKAQETFQDKDFEHSTFIDSLFEFSHWHYRLQTYPPVHVLDTRTQRWRSESNKNKPSGLMDWEGLCELQQNIIGQDAVILVSAAPVYGVKFIEMVQKIFTIFGGALMVDAENWMAHRGTASVMLNIFRHVKTPPNFIILSGDVHYSFVYDVNLRFSRNSPKILQFTCSGMNNEFPDTLLTWFERLNKWFYGHRSPLNWLTKRRNMSIKKREPENASRDIINACSYGLLELDENGNEIACKVVCADGKTVTFKPKSG